MTFNNIHNGVGVWSWIYPNDKKCIPPPSLGITMLTDIAIRNAKPKEKDYKLSDERGLYLLVVKTGGKLWRLKFRKDGKERLLALGSYPDVTLSHAREKRDAARRDLAHNIDPVAKRKAEKASRAMSAANTFEAVAREWFSKFKADWADNHADRIIRRFERDLFPWLGNKPIAEMKAQEVLEVIRKVEKRGALETAHRAMGNCGQVCRYAVATGRAERDVTVDLRGALPAAKGKNLAAVTEPKRVGELLRILDGHTGTVVVNCALRLAPLVFVRPGELRSAKWTDIDLETAEWRYTVSKTKTEHIVPLSTQAIAILKEIQPITGHGIYVFPGARMNGRPMSEGAVLAAMRSLGIPKDEMSGHGFRAMARTILDEVLGWRPDLIEHQLAHAVRDPNGRAYNRTAHLPERHKMLQTWSDYLDALKSGGNVIAFAQRTA